MPKVSLGQNGRLILTPLLTQTWQLVNTVKILITLKGLKVRSNGRAKEMA